jgi:propanol-preferring alcohol dehydrogenase
MPETMRAAVLPAYKAELELTDMPVPQPQGGEVLIRVRAAGVCHSDLHLIEGEPPALPRFPWILGHEVAGEVAALGPAASGVNVGDLVAVFGGQGCGACPNCISGHEQLCTVGAWSGTGVGRPGGYAEYMIAPAARHLCPLNGVEPTVAAALTDAGLTPYRAVRRALPFLPPDGTAVVIGLGALGQYAVQYLRMFSPARVVGVDPNEGKRSTALQLGADLSLDAASQTLTDDLDQQSIAGAASVVVDLVGSDASLQLASRCIGPRGMLVIVGLGGGTMPVGFLTMQPEMTLTNTYWGTPSELVQVLALQAAGRLHNNITTYPLDQAQQAIADLEHGEVAGRAVLVP